MIATTIGVSIRIWLASANPDSSVQTVSGLFPDTGEFFMNTANGALYVCTQGGPNQTWQATTNTSMVMALIASNVLQSNWTQSNTSSQDFIKNKPTIPAVQVQSDWTQTNTTSLDYIKNKPALPSDQIQSDWAQTNTSAVDFIKNKPLARSQSIASRALNTVFQVSSSRDSLVNYSVEVSTSLTLTGGAQGTVFLEIASNSGFTLNVQELARFTNANTGTLAVGLSLTQIVTANLTGYVPLNYYVRLRTVNTTGTPTFTTRSSQEVLL